MEKDVQKQESEDLRNVSSNFQEDEILQQIIRVLKKLRSIKKDEFNRVLPLGDYFFDRWEKATYLGFGVGTSVYDNVVVIGNVNVGKNTWIGPNVILDGSGNLRIGSNCSISAGTQIYTHDTIQWAISGGKAPYEYAQTVIEDNCYIGPNVVIQKGVRIGTGSIVGTNSFVNKDIPPHSKAYGTPVTVKPLNT